MSRHHLVHGHHEIDGLGYAVSRRGSPGRPALVLLHGFTGAATSWAEHLPELGEAFELLMVDLPGHGRSGVPAEPSRASVERVSDDLARLLERFGPAPAHLLGYSLGARVALRLAIAHPGVVRRLVLESPSAGIVDPDERAARREADEALAGSLERHGIAPFVEHWERQPLFASQATLPEERRAIVRRERLANRPDGLAASLRGAGQGVMEPLHDRLGAVAAPTLVVAGALDHAGLDRARAVAAGIPDARLAVVPDAGHRIHLEQPARFRRLVLEFLTEVPAT